MASRIAITGMGLVSALGWTPKESWAALEAEQSGLGPLRLFHSPCCGHFPVAELRGDPAGKSGLAWGSRCDHMALIAAREAFLDSGIEGIDPKELQHTGVILGASTGGMLGSESFLERLYREQRFDTDLLRHHECCSSTEAVAGALGCEGICSTVSTACASGCSAIGLACDALQTGHAWRVICGGVDCLTRLTLNGFASLLIVDPRGCRPFDAGRAGMSLGEGAGVLVLELEERARARGARIHARVAGWGSSCDALHATAPDPDGAALQRAMRQALASAGLEPGQVDYINAHGTGTRDNDLAEARSIIELFGPSPPRVSSTKRFFGHTLAAAGAIEAVVGVLALEHQRVPGNLGLGEVDPGIAIEPVRHPEDAGLQVVMSNSVGFGGNNCSVILRSLA